MPRQLIWRRDYTKKTQNDWIETVLFFPSLTWQHIEKRSNKNSSFYEAKQPQQVKRDTWELLPWVMWWACLPRGDKLDGFPAALAVLHQDGDRILPTRQGAGQRLAGPLRPFCSPGSRTSLCVFSWPLTDRMITSQLHLLNRVVFFFNTIF